MSDATSPGSPDQWGPPAVERTGWWRREFAEPLGIASVGLAAILVIVNVLWMLTAHLVFDFDFAVAGVVSGAVQVVGFVLALGAALLGVVAIGRGRRRTPTQLGWVGMAVGAYVLVTITVDFVTRTAMIVIFDR